MRKKLLFVAVACLMAVQGFADNDYSYLTFTKNNQSEQSFPAVGLTITFADGKAVVIQNGSTTTFEVSELSKMYFSSVAAGVETLQKSDAPLTVYNVAGQPMGTFKNESDLNSSLKSGVYIVRQNGKTFKLAVK